MLRNALGKLTVVPVAATIMLLSSGMFLAYCAWSPIFHISSPDGSMLARAREYVAAFRDGRGFFPPATGIMNGGLPDDAALEFLGRELGVGDTPVREGIVGLLVDAGLRTDPLKSEGAETIRNHKIIALLAGPGLMKPDAGRSLAIGALLKFGKPADLATHGKSILAALENAPSASVFLLAAKAKPLNGAALALRVSTSPRWERSEEARIARAAFGDTKIEDEYIGAAIAAVEGEELAGALVPLSMIGTPRSLAAIGGLLRTPLIIDKPGAYKKSVRLNVLDALRHTYPDQPVLYPNNINDEADYAAAERFCIGELGISYAAPRPPFLTYRGYPVPMPME